MINVKITTAGLDRLEAKVNRASNFLGRGGMRTVLDDSGEDLVREFRRNIESFTPGVVQDLAESTKKQKMRQVGFQYPILIRTRQMIDSMYAKAKLSARGWVVGIGFRGSQKGVRNEDIARAHIEGNGRLPKRDFTEIPKRWKSNLWRRIRTALWRK